MSAAETWVEASPAVASVALFAVCAVVSFVAVALLRPVLQRYALARPNARSSHKIPTPQGGGMAVIGVAALAIGAGHFALPAAHRATPLELAVVVSGAVALAIVGAVDDIRGLSALSRLLLQAVAVGALVAVLPTSLRAIPFLPFAIERAVLVLGGVWIVNLTNFMDGLDWMTVAELVPVGLGFVLLGALGALPPRGVVAAIAVTGGLLGFAPWNRPVAKIFLGDVGSIPLGFLWVWLLTLLAGRGHLAAALILPLYYLADATITLLRRAANRERVWEAHRTHFYQRATDHGHGVVSIVGRVFATNVALVALATYTVLRPSTLDALAAMAAACAVVGALLRSFMKRVDR